MIDLTPTATELAFSKRREQSAAESASEQLRICESIEALTFDEMCALVDRTFEYQRTNVVPF